MDPNANLAEQRRIRERADADGNLCGEEQRRLFELVEGLLEWIERQRVSSERLDAR